MAEANRLYRPDQYERQPHDFYPTPPEATQYLLETVPLRDFVWEPCAGQGLMAKTITDAGYRVVASEAVEYENSLFPIITGIDALESLLPAGVKTVVTNPPYGNMPRKLIPYWLSLLEPVGGMLCLLMNSLWGKPERPAANQPASRVCRQGADEASHPVARWHTLGQGWRPADRSRLADLGLESRSDETAVRPVAR